MKAQLLRFLDVQKGEGSRVALLLVMSFFMVVFLATVSVASQSLFLKYFDEQTDLPLALLISGSIGLVATILYNFLQNRISFPLLGTLSLLVVTGLTAFMEFGQGLFDRPQDIYFIGFTLMIPFSFITYLNFWGGFSRLFNLRQAKRLIGTVDLGAMLASFIAFFLIPQYLSLVSDPASLYSVGLISLMLYVFSFVYLSVRFLNKSRSFAQEKVMYKKVPFKDFLKNRYMRYMSLFVIVSMIAVNFVDYSFLNVTTLYLDEKTLASFIAYFEMTIVIFGFLFQLLATDRIIKEYGMRVSLLINPLLLLLFTVCALTLGFVFGYSPTDNLFVVFFLIIAVSKLFIRSLKDSLDSPTFKLYLLPIESDIRIDVQTKIEGFVTAFASLAAGGLIILINKVEIFSIIFISLFTLPLLLAWYFITNRLHVSYRNTLQKTLLGNKTKTSRPVEKEYRLSSLLEKEVNSTAEEKVIYALKLMEKLEPALFENSVMRLAHSGSRKIKNFASEKITELGLQSDLIKTPTRTLAEKAYGELEDSDLLSISPERLLKLSKSVKQSDRILASKLLRKLTGPKTIFVLLELMRDADPKVRFEALYTARKVNRQETWSLLIELLSSPTYSHHAAAALKEVGEPILPALEAAFHKSGQSDLVMLRIVQIMGKIGGELALELLWKKADYPDKRIVKQILYSLRFINYRAGGREVRDVFNLLETEMGKTIWNMAALQELPHTPEFQYLHEALKEEVADNYDQIIMLLSILYDSQSVQLVHDNLESGDPDNIAFALELLDLFIAPELKPKLLPLLDESPVTEKLKQLQVYFPRENYNPIQVINYILNRDYNLNNRWTKACAIHAAAYIPDFRVSRGLVAQMFNSDRLLQETAAWVIYHKDKKLYAAIAERLPARDKKFLDSSIENNALLDGLNDGFYLFMEIVLYVKQTLFFKNIHGLLLSDLADKIVPVNLDPGERVKLASDEHNTPVFIVGHGEVKLLGDNSIITVLERGDVYGDLFQDGIVPKVHAIEATESAVVFKINLMDFYFVLANHHELVQGLIRNITEETNA